MPRLLWSLERCVFFLFGKNTQTGNVIGPGATGFFVAKHSSTLQSLFHVYAVTNRHAVDKYHDIRINTCDGSSKIIEFDPSEWVYSEADDLAALDVTDSIVPEQRSDGTHNISWILEHSMYSRQFGWSAAMGDQTVMLGLFADHAESKLNVPVARFGNIAAMPNVDSPVRLRNNDAFVRPAFLNDMRSRTGFSGSPVWVWHNPYDDMNWPELYGYKESISTPHQRRRASLTLIGIHRGQFWEKTTALSSQTAHVRVGDSFEIASSMTVVVPGGEILTMLDLPKFAAQRDARDARQDRIDAHGDNCGLS
jgi:hypothetical protein